MQEKLLTRKILSRLPTFSTLWKVVRLALLCFTQVVWSQQTATYEGIKPGRFMTRWLVLGPVPVFADTANPEDLQKQRRAFQTDYLPPFISDTPVEGQAQTINGRQFRWQAVDSPGETVDLETIYGAQDYVAAYAWAQINLPEESTLLLAVGSDDGMRVWINGELVHDHWIGRPLIKDQDIFPVTLRQGKNQLLLKIQDMQYDWGFACRVLPAEVPAIERARLIVRESMRESRVPGMSLAVGKNGKIVWSEGFGYADLEQYVPVVEETRFRIGSVSKPLTAAAIALLVEEGRLNLDAPVQQYVPSFPEKRWPVTTRQLAGHLAGIRHYKDEEFLSSKHYTNVLEGLEFFRDDTLLFEPGSRYLYSSYGWNLVSAVVEGASGENFLDYMQENIFDPLGMDHTSADHTDRIIPRRTRFYELRPDNRVYNAAYVDNSYKWAGGGFLSTASDLVRFGMAHLIAPFLKPETIKMLWTSQHTDDGKDTGYGIGWFVGRDRDGRSIVLHGGGSIGGSAFLLLFPDDALVIAMIANSSGPTSYNEAWTIAEGFLMPPEELVVPPGSQPNLAGYYECTTIDEDKETPLTIQLMGLPGDYWGRVKVEESKNRIIHASSRQNRLRIIALSPAGRVSNLLLTVNGHSAAGSWNRRPVKGRLKKIVPEF